MNSSSLTTGLQHKIDLVHQSLCKLVSWFTLFMVLITFLIVVLRYGFNLGWIAMQESVMYLHATVFLLGAAHTLKVNEHVRVDIFYRQMSQKKKAWVDTLGTLLLLMPVNCFILALSFDYVIKSWQILESSPQAGGLAFVFVLKTLILLFAVSMNLQGLAELIRNILIIKHSQKIDEADKGEV
ncbi:TRAP transporter small permease subunit [Paraglaciecola aquimarina]|uniref:TRAP transporter small permease protein n=1 Tax=Paraglaciecola algarum TaxID=3050085 RepID=A0ABS9DBQ6_9ALTE|nr:TRAP transporter small permease subunit [Paraglaciecola sp. G1-23]MCF2949061.1 TRAP transporter small permease subunit [Paraglaciecola sp. G1-23]